MKLLLDEMWTPTIAFELRKRDFDVIAVNEPAHASRYAGIPDDTVFALAQDDARTIVTDNVADYERARRDWESRGRVHALFMSGPTSRAVQADISGAWPER